MTDTRWLVLHAGAAALAFAVSPVLAQAPPGYPANYGEVIAAANREGSLVVLSVTSAVPSLLQDFQALYPGVKLQYVAVDTTPLYERVTSEARTGRIADVAWSSAMDLQIKLVSEGHAMSYDSPEAVHLPGWAVWRNEAFATSYEPVGIVYNKHLMEPAEVPQTRADFVKLLASRPDKFKDKVVTFDPETSGLGFLLMTQDARVSAAGFWEVVRAMGAAGLRVQSGSGAMFGRIASGEALIGYNLLGSYARGRARNDLPALGLVLPRDQTLVMSRILFITKGAPHPNAARLWVDYVLSRRGQELVAQSGLGSIRADVEGEMTRSALREQLGPAVKPIPVGPDLLGYLEAGKRLEFLRQWQDAVKRAK